MIHGNSVEFDSQCLRKGIYGTLFSREKVERSKAPARHWGSKTGAIRDEERVAFDGRQILKKRRPRRLRSK